MYANPLNLRHAPAKMYRLNRERVEELINGIGPPERPLEEIATELNTSRRSLMRFCQIENININRRRGRKPQAITEEQIDLVLGQRGHMRKGLAKVFEELRNANHGIPKHIIGKIYEEMGLFKFRTERAKQERCQYEAEQRDLIWHTDLHEIQITDEGRKYLIALIDDASRLIVGWKLLNGKHAYRTANFLIRVLHETETCPLALWSDNGCEFKAEFDLALEQNNIMHIKTEPYNPQQNGKIERFWQVLNPIHDRETLKLVMDEYNDSVHFALPRIRMEDGTNRCMTPRQRYQQLEKWGEGKQSWRINGESKPFPPDVS
jgi:transposase InsO family protein